MESNPSRRIALRAAAALLGATALRAFAQGYPGGGRMRGGGRPEQRIEGGEKPREGAMPPHRLALLAAALEREAPTMKLTPTAATAMASFVRELKDFAALEDRQARERTGASRGVIHATVDLQRDLADAEESAHELDAAAKDVIARWKALREALDDAQRERVQALYANALLDSRRPVR